MRYFQCDIVSPFIMCIGSFGVPHLYISRKQLIYLSGINVDFGDRQYDAWSPVCILTRNAFLPPTSNAVDITYPNCPDHSQQAIFKVVDYDKIKAIETIVKAA